jgi:hypothetical protein
LVRISPEACRAGAHRAPSRSHPVRCPNPANRELAGRETARSRGRGSAEKEGHQAMAG